MSDAATEPQAGFVVGGITALGRAGLRVRRRIVEGVRYAGGVGYLLVDTALWTFRGLCLRSARFGWSALFSQMVRVGVQSVPIIVLVQTFIGIILALQLQPTLEQYGSTDKIANIIGIAMFRELGPLLSAVVLSGFAGASIAAEIGAMVESEEIKALRAHALNPIRFLVVPRTLATIIMLTGLAIIADVVGVCGGMMISWWVLGIEPAQYLDNTRTALVYRDFFTGLSKAAVFGMLISMIACYEGLTVQGGAEGVGRATTSTVVKSIVALIATDCLFTAVFFMFGL
ncbi:MAG: ABC transporter permease [Phycisphaerae bacterium]|nr:ABC transporter permease [Phycisphaerae bacterium]